MTDSKLWADAYASYKRAHPADRPKPKKHSHPRPIRRPWLELTKEYYRLKKTPRFSRWRRNQFLRQGGLCYYCGEPLWSKRENIEHVKPRSLGGDNRWANLVLACSTCNKEKGSKRLSYNERKRLREINRARRGTYLQNRELYKSDVEFALELHERCRE